MNTARGLITRAMRILKALGDGEVPSASEAADGLVALNTMLDGWSLEPSMLYTLLLGSYTWNATVASRTIGPGGDFATALPVRIAGAYFTLGSVDYKVRVIQGRNGYDDVAVKAINGIPGYLFVDSGFPLTTLYAYPHPSQPMTISISANGPLGVLTLDQTIAMPPGYERVMTYCLAVEIAAEFGLPISPETAAIAGMAKANVKRMNAKTPESNISWNRSARYDIRSG